MNQISAKRRKAVVDESYCVACGCCVKVCPLKAITVFKGITARSTGSAALAAESALKNVPHQSLQSRRLPYEKTLV